MKRDNSSIAWIIFIIIVLVAGVIIITKTTMLSREFADLRTQNMATTFTLAATINIISHKIQHSKALSIKNCKDIVKIAGIILPMDYEIEDKQIKRGEQTICSLKDNNTTVAQFIVVGT